MPTSRTFRGGPSFASGTAVTLVWAAWAGALASASGTARGAPPTDRAAAEAAEEPALVSERLKLTTSDNVSLAAWYYPAAKPDADAGAKTEAPAVVILLHGLEGSHRSVEPLAHELQAGGAAVVAPDLRGHGATTSPEDRPDAKSLKKADFASMAMTGGGRVREQADARGEVEVVRNWIKARSDSGELDIDKLVVVGCGVGAAVAAQWAVLDAKWPDLASGPQGGQVRGLVLVSPTWITNGFAISQALGTEPVRRSLPVLVICGAQDGDAVKIYDQLKRQRPDAWSERRVGRAQPTQAPKLAEGARPTLYLREFDTRLSGDRLAATVPEDRRSGGHPAAIIEGFIGAVTAPEP